jgi:hypothetical protein
MAMLAHQVEVAVPYRLTEPFVVFALSERVQLVRHRLPVVLG